MRRGKRNALGAVDACSAVALIAVLAGAFLLPSRRNWACCCAWQGGSQRYFADEARRGYSSRGAALVYLRGVKVGQSDTTPLFHPSAASMLCLSLLEQLSTAVACVRCVCAGSWSHLPLSLLVPCWWRPAAAAVAHDVVSCPGYVSGWSRWRTEDQHSYGRER